MRSIWWVFIAAFLLTACGDKKEKADLSGDAPIKQKDFFKAFKSLKLPMVLSDTGLARQSDAAIINPKLLGQFVPDSTLRVLAGKNAKHLLHAVGSIHKDGEWYILINAVADKNIALHALVFDEKGTYLAQKELLRNYHTDGYSHQVEINREPTFTIAKELFDHQKNDTKYSRTAWAYFATTNAFNVVLNESNEDEKKNNTIINPIDTLARKNKYSGNYVQDSKNFISLRDGKTSGSYLFFVHFDNENGCTGELKGELQMRTETTGAYVFSGDPCAIDFTFEGNEILVKERGSCGNHRGINCQFNDRYIRKKEAVKKEPKKDSNKKK